MIDESGKSDDYIRLRYLAKLGLFSSVGTMLKKTYSASKNPITDALTVVCGKIARNSIDCHPYIKLIAEKPVSEEEKVSLEKPVQQFLKFIESLNSVELPNLVPDPAGSSRITHTGYAASQKNSNPAIYLLGQAFQYFLDNHQTHKTFDDFNGIFQTIIHTHRDKTFTGTPIHRPKL